MKEQLEKFSELKKKNTAVLQKLKQELVIERKKRNGDENGIEHLLYKVLEAHNIKKQHFHRGAMKGVCSRRLLDNVESIFEEIKN